MPSQAYPKNPAGLGTRGCAVLVAGAWGKRGDCAAGAPCVILSCLTCAVRFVVLFLGSALHAATNCTVLPCVLRVSGNKKLGMGLHLDCVSAHRCCAHITWPQE